MTSSTSEAANKTAAIAEELQEEARDLEKIVKEIELLVGKDSRLADKAIEEESYEHTMALPQKTESF